MGYRKLTRRDFMKTGAAGLGAASLARFAHGSDDAPMPTRRLGRTGVEVSILGLGGFHLGTIREDKEAVDFCRRAIDMGVTFMDNAWEYHMGRSERIMGEALQGGYRDKAFLMTKHHGRRDKKDALKHLDDSLKRLKTDVIDLWQIHEIVWEDDPEMIFSPGGAIEAFEEAKQAGKVRFTGFTGHKHPDLHKEMLDHDYEWDTVQMPINVLDAHFRSFRENIVPICEERGIGIIGMKPMASGAILKAGAAGAEECLRYAWSQPTSVVLSGMTTQAELEHNVRAAKSFTPLSEDEEQTLLAKTEEPAMTGDYERFKTSRRFDGPIGRRIHNYTG